MGATGREMHIRPYEPADLDDLYRICLLTGDAGADASDQFDDPNLLGHFWAAPYAVHEPDLAWVLADGPGGGGGVVGYVLGTRDSVAFAGWMDSQWLPALRRQYPLPPAGDRSRDAAMIRMIHRGYAAPPFADDYPAHLHIDLLPAAQRHGHGRALMTTLLERLRTLRVPGVHLGVGRGNTGAIAFYQRLGFQLLHEHPWGLELGLRLGPAGPTEQAR